jgi:hypothetical protein
LLALNHLRAAHQPRRFQSTRAAARSTAVERFDLQRIALPQMMAVPRKGADPPPE